MVTVTHCAHIRLESPNADYNVNTMPIAYSYKRFSSADQEGNDSIRRQTAAAIAYIEDNPQLGLVLDQTLSMTDAGVSAFKGTNLKTGALGIFTDAVRSGMIPEGSFLLLESLDRFTRQQVNLAAAELLGLLNRGIVVVTLNNGNIYREEDFSEGNGLVNLLGALIAMEGHHREQVTKGKRVTAAWSAKYSRIADGHIVSKLVPFWLRVKAERTGFELIDHHVETVRQIYRMNASGIGKVQIASTLMRQGAPTAKGKSNVWHSSSVNKVLANDAVVGTFTNSRGEVFKNYYPSVVSVEDHQVVKSLRNRQPANGNSPKAHVLTSLVKHECGSVMRRYNKGERSIIKLRCPKCRNALPFSVALSAVSSALSNLQWEAAATVKGTDTFQLEQDHLGLSYALEEAFVTWKSTKSKADMLLYQRLLQESEEVRTQLNNLKSIDTEILLSMESAALLSANKTKEGLIAAVRKVATSITLDHECKVLTLTSISGKVVAEHVNI